MTNVDILLHTQPGEKIRLVPDLCLLNDDLSHKMPQLGAEGMASALCQRTMVILDHDIPAGSFDTAFRQKALIELSRKYDLPFVQAEGIGYALLRRRYLQRGQLLLGWGDHVCAVGAVGALGLQLTDNDLEHVLRTGWLDLTVPQRAALRFTGRLPDGVDIYDAAISLLPGLGQIYQNKLLMLVDSTEDGLDPDKRQVLCQLLHRLGAVSALFLSEEETVEALGKETRLSECSLSGAALSMVLPGCMTHIVPVAGQSPVKVDACFIGGCCGGHIAALRQAANILRGKRIKRELRLLVGFADNEDYLCAMKEGLIEVFLDCGAQVTNPGCASCRTTSIGVVGNGEAIASTGCYNFPGCCGTSASRVYLASVETVARAALSGFIQMEEEG